MVPGQPVRCVCGGAFMAPAGVPSVVCPYCRQPVMVPVMYAVAPPPAAVMTETRRSWAIGLIAVAIVATLVGTFTRSWLRMSDGREEASLGLLGYEECEHGRCKTEDYDAEHDKLVRILGIVGKAAVAGTLALIGILAWTGARVIGRKPAVGPSITGTIVGALAAAGATAWMVTLREALHERLEIGWSFGVYVVGAACAIVACTLARAPTS